MCSESQG